MLKSKIDLYSETNQGLKRPNNEDEAATVNRDGFQVALVADGMGGHSSGEVASRIARETLVSYLSNIVSPKNIRLAKKEIKKGIKKANTLIHRLSAKNAECYGMGTTLVLAFRLQEDTIVINCGDSRCYSFSSKDGIGLKQLTVDQTIVEYLYKLGAISKSDMQTSPKRHVLMNALGIDPSVSYDVTIIPNDYDLILTCSDGLTNMVSDKKMEEIIASNKDMDSKSLTKRLMKEALDNGGIDNIGIAIMEVK